MPRLAPAVFWLGMIACLLVGALAAVTELCIGTRLDPFAEWLARR